MQPPPPRVRFRSRHTRPRANPFPIDPFQFLALPPELRLIVYRCLLVKPTTIILNHNLAKLPTQLPQHRQRSLEPSILRTSKQIYTESRAVLYSENRFLMPITLFHYFPLEVSPWVHRPDSTSTTHVPARMPECNFKRIANMILVIDFTQWEDYLNQLTSASQQVPRFTRCLKLQLRAVTQLFIQGNSLRVLKLSLKSSDQDQSLERVTPVLEHLRLLRWVKLEKVEFDKGFLPVIGELLEWARGLREEIKGNKPFVID